MHTPRLLRLMEEFPDNGRLNALITATLDHAVSAMVCEENVSARHMRQVDMPTMLRLILANVRKPEATNYLLNHAFDLLANCTNEFSRDFKACPPAIALLTACLRSQEITTRCNALGGLIRLLHGDSDHSPVYQDPQKFLAAIQRGFPPHLNDALMQYDPQRCDTFLTLQSSVEYQKAMMKCLRDKDLVSLGRTLGRLITTTEYSVSEGVCFFPFA